MSSGRGWLWAAVIVLAAAALRLASLDRVPPGLHYDEAAFGVLALDLLREPRIQVFFPAFTGLEPAFIYLSAASTWLIGPSGFALRLVGALVGVGAVAATLVAGRALAGWTVGLLAAALLAGSFWHVLISRMAYGAGLMALVPTIAVWLIWRMCQRPNAPRGALAGVAFSAIGYTYVGARLLPLALGAFVLLELVLARRPDDQQAAESRSGGWRAAAAGFVLAAAVAIAPLAIHFARHPEQLIVRVGQTLTVGGTPGEVASTLLRGIGATLATYGVRGDPLQKYNLPLRSALEAPVAALLVVGLIGVLAGLRDPRHRLLLLWWLGALAPSFVTVGSPNHLRLVGAAPPSYLIAALGLVFVGRLALGRLGGQGHRWAPRLAVVGALVLALGQAALAWRDYFGDWAISAETYYALEGDVADLARLAAAQPDDMRLYAASEHYRHPTVAYLSPAAFNRLAWLDGRMALVLPPPGQTAQILVPRAAHPPDASLLGEPAMRVADPSGDTSVAVYRITGVPASGAALAIFLDERYGAVAELLRVEMPERARAGEMLPVRLTWRLLADAPPAAYDVFVHAIDSSGRRWGQRDASPYLTPEWRSGETLIAFMDVPIDPTAPPGAQWLRIGLNDTARGQAIEARRPDGQPLHVPLDLPRIGSVAHGAARPIPELLAHFRLGSPESTVHEASLGEVTLLASGYPRRLRAGDRAWIDLLWIADVDRPSFQPGPSGARGGAAEVVLRGGDGAERPVSPVSLRRLAELDRGTPWLAGEPMRDVRLFEPMRDEVGVWTLVVRLDGRELVLGPIQIDAPAGDFTPPEPQVVVEAQFGGFARLVGFDVETNLVRLYWQGLGPADANYTVFVHALGPEGRILAQHDAAPATGARPTRGWAASEFIRDEHPLLLPDGTEQLAIGLYDPASGRRVPVIDGGDHIVVPLAPGG